MDLLDIVYHLMTSNLSSSEYNEVINLVKDANKEYLFHQSFDSIKEKLFEELRK